METYSNLIFFSLFLLGSCNENMGLESMKIPDDAITASSYNSSATIPQHVRFVYV